MEIDKRSQQLLVLAGILPVIADMIEDLNDDLFKQSLKHKAKSLHEEIIKNDQMILKATGMEIINEQITIQRAFHIWINSGFDIDKANEIIQKTIVESKLCT